MSLDPRQLVLQLEAHPLLPRGDEERFNGYGVMGLPFDSGHVLAMRRFVATSVGPGYTSVWHRRPDGSWTLYADAPPGISCARYFGAGAVESIETKIDLEWIGATRMRVAMPHVEFEWEITASQSGATRLMNTFGRLLPDQAWRRRNVLSAMGRLAGPLLGVGRVGLQGTAPNGQYFMANPRLLWRINESTASFRGIDLGKLGRVNPQARLGDFWIPQRGMLAIGQAYFEPFDPDRHISESSLQSRVFVDQYAADSRRR